VTVPLAPSTAARHPNDPEPVACTKATAVFVLGLVALVTGPLVGGLVPAAVALGLARQAREDLAAGGGYLTGGEHLRRGELLAWIGIGLAALALAVAALAAILAAADGPMPRDFPDTVD
jgi:4-amino-4-deoxy-L-arabinose transferase-like glycosyltransferase